MKLEKSIANNRITIPDVEDRPQRPPPSDLAFEIRSLCHDLNQPVAAAQMILGALACEPLTVAAAGHVAALREELASIAATITGEPGRVRHRAELVELGSLVAGCARTAERARGVRVHVTTAGRSRVVGVASDLRRAVGNVLDNACRASSSGNVEVSVTGAGEWCEVVVSDDGPGFGEIEAGAGIGLRQVRATLGEHGGRMDVAAAERGGTVVHLSFPGARTLAS